MEAPFDRLMSEMISFFFFISLFSFCCCCCCYCYFVLLLIFTKIILLFYFIFFFFHEFFFYFFMFRDVPVCSGMFRNVPACSGMFCVPGFIDAPFHKHANSKVEKPPPQLRFSLPSIIITITKHTKRVEIHQAPITNHDLKVF